TSLLCVSVGGRLSRELQYVKEQVGEGAGSTSQILIQTPKRQGADILTQEALLVHLKAAMVATQVKVDMYDITWKLTDICYAPPAPAFGDYVMDNILEKLFPCVMVGPLDCFWEGSKLLGPWQRVVIP
ncbi:PREDICTED: protein patched homolog 1-like, partial [Priapulus caudatus]|uniref:Protein patched homolog 1-like n=1 Tax=Priapulus caudatus TaxID=37621 RepID=A0ABM1F4G1_PRICU